MFETGHFATLWRAMAARFGLEVDFVPGDWRHGVDPAASRRGSPRTPRTHQGGHGRPQRDVDRRDQPHRRHPRRDRPCRTPALLMVDTISSLGSVDYRHDEWGVDVTVAGSQKGLMLPPGLASTRSRRRRAPPRTNAAAALLLGLGGDDRSSTRRLLSLHAGDQSALRAARGDRDAARGRARQRVRPPSAAGRSDARARSSAGGSRCCARNPASIAGADRRDDAAGPRRRRFRKVMLDRFDMSLGAGLGKSRARYSVSAISAISTT